MIFLRLYFSRSLDQTEVDLPVKDDVATVVEAFDEQSADWRSFLLFLDFLFFMLIYYATILFKDVHRLDTTIF